MVFSILPKNEKKINLNNMIPQVVLVSFIFRKNFKTPKRHFEINWPLVSTKPQLFIMWDPFIQENDKFSPNFCLKHFLSLNQQFKKAVYKGMILNLLVKKWIYHHQTKFDSFQIVKLKFLCRIEMLTEDSVLVVTSMYVDRGVQAG